MIYCVIFVNNVLPVCFLQNLLLYVASACRNAVNLTGKGGPHGPTYCGPTQLCGNGSRTKHQNHFNFLMEILL